MKRDQKGWALLVAFSQIGRTYLCTPQAGRDVAGQIVCCQVGLMSDEAFARQWVRVQASEDHLLMRLALQMGMECMGGLGACCAVSGLLDAALIPALCVDAMGFLLHMSATAWILCCFSRGVMIGATALGMLRMHKRRKTCNVCIMCLLLGLLLFTNWPAFMLVLICLGWSLGYSLFVSKERLV